MKVRTDFVTNSSSSSFILAFKDEESIERTLKGEGLEDEYYERVLDDCLKAEKLNMEDVLVQAREEMYWDIYYDIRYYEKEHFTTDEEVEAETLRRLAEELEDFKHHLEHLHRDVFVEVEYCDNEGQFEADMEHEIMPDLDCRVKTYNHH